MDPPSPIIPSFVYEHHHQDQDPLLSPSSSFLCHPLMFNHGEGSFDSGNLYQHHQFHESAMYASDGRSVPSPNSLSSMEKEIDEHGFKLSILGGDHKDYDQGAEGSSAGNNWMSSSKIMNYDQKQSSSPFSTENVRVCSDCNTTKTPLWRSGPKGPKSLCNACGIRQRKARRAMAATTTAGTSTTTGVSLFKQKSSGKNLTPQSKKQCKLTPRRKKKLGFEDFVISLSNNSAFHRMFPQDETEAAILLMALSCGLVCD